jgi:14-3-3 protein epsilon
MWNKCDPKTLLWLARVAEKIKRNDHFVIIINQFISIHPKLNVKERFVFATGHRANLSSLRESLQVFKEHRLAVAEKGDQNLISAIDSKIFEYQSKLQHSCLNLIRQIESILLPEGNDPISSAFYKRLIGDCYRYIAEHAAAADALTWAERAENAYRAGLAQAVRELPRSHPLYLGLAVNLAVCQCELCGNRQAAVKFSEEVFNEAVKTIDGLAPDLHSEAVEVMQVLRENITNWSDG